MSLVRRVTRPADAPALARPSLDLIDAQQDSLRNGFTPSLFKARACGRSISLFHGLAQQNARAPSRPTQPPRPAQPSTALSRARARTAALMSRPTTAPTIGNIFSDDVEALANDMMSFIEDKLAYRPSRKSDARNALTQANDTATRSASVLRSMTEGSVIVSMLNTLAGSGRMMPA